MMYLSLNSKKKKDWFNFGEKKGMLEHTFFLDFRRTELFVDYSTTGS